GGGARAAAYAGACDGGHAARRGPRGLSRRRSADPGTRRLPVPRPARTRTRRSRVPPAARWRDGTEVDHRLRGTRAAPLRDRLRLLLIAPSARLGDVELRRVLDGGGCLFLGRSSRPVRGAPGDAARGQELAALGRIVKVRALVI